MEEMKIKSSSFKDGEMIPTKYTCDGEDTNPLLEIRHVPDNAKSLALIIDDPDATRGVPWDHWLMWNIPPRSQYIQEGVVPSGAVQGTGSNGKIKYMGPCPVKGKDPHHYIFSLYALDCELELPEGAKKDELLRAMEGHIISKAELVGMYGR
ncbi:MAG: putative phospholipid-binding protein, PBP family [Parcubacteria group bacterium LiPW_41]|nr:MAG: putative phospholipid-binding protein, PBP family [Parcubacteria group bacterium LiPW_41]